LRTFADLLHLAYFPWEEFVSNIINYWMSEALVKFLEANYGQFNPPIEHKFVTGLKNSSGTTEGLNRIRDTVLRVAEGKMETEQGR
jgi:hypothetical protein